MQEREEKRIHIPTGGREGTTLIITNPETARRVRRDIRRNSTPDAGSKGRRIRPQKNTNR